MYKTALLFAFALGLLTTNIGVMGQGVTNDTEKNEESLEFFVGTWNQTIEWAELAKKPIFVYIHTAYNSQCKTMVNKIFASPSCIDYFGLNFVCLKMNMNSAEGMELIKKYELKTNQPNYLFFTQEGDFIFKDGGEKTENELIEISEKAINKQEAEAEVNVMQASAIYQTFFDLKFEYETTQDKKPELLFKYAYELKKFNEDFLDVAKQYIESEVKTNIKNKKNMQFVIDFIDDINSPAFNLLINNKKDFIEAFDSETITEAVKTAIVKTVENAADKKDKAMFDKALNWAIKANLKDATKFSFELKNMYYKVVQDWETLTRITHEYIIGNTIKDDVLLNKSAWLFALYAKDKTFIADASAWAKKATELEPSNFDYIAIYAATLYKLDKKDKALDEIKRAIQQARWQGKTYKHILKLQTAMESNKPVPNDIFE